MAKLPAPQQNTYLAHGPLGGRITARIDSGASLSTGADSIARGLGSLAGGLGALAEVVEKQEYQKQTLDAMSEVQSFQDREREMLTQMNEMKGAAGFDAPAFMEAFYAKEKQDLTGRAKGDFQKMYYEKSLATARDTGLNVAFGHRAQELENYKQSVVNGQMTNLDIEIDNLPGNWRDIEARGVAAIRAANVGLDTTAQEYEFRRQLAKRGVASAVARGDRETAEGIVNNFGTAPERVELQKTFDEAESKARVGSFIQEGVAAYQSGQSVEYRQKLLEQEWGTPEELEKVLQGVKTIEENDRGARKARAEEMREQAEDEWLQAKLNGTATPEMIRNDYRLPAEYRERAIKELTSDRKPSLDNAKGREIDTQIRRDIAQGLIDPNDPMALTAVVNSYDPDTEYISSDTINKYRTLLKETRDQNGDPKRNYLTETLAAVGKREEFQGKSDDAKAEGALRLLGLKDAVMNELELGGISVYDPAAGQAVLKAVEKMVVTKPGVLWDTKERWYMAPPETRGPLLNRPAPTREAPAPGGGPGQVEGDVWSNTVSLFGADENNTWSTPKQGGVGGVLAGGMAAANLLALAAEDYMRSQAMPDNSFTRAWAEQGIIAQRPAREVVPDFALDWAGQGRVTAGNLGRVHDYNGLIERHALSYGLDPNLIAAMMYVESRGNPNAVSPAGARGLMQFMPATAQRFGITDPTDPNQSIRGACQYMRWLLDRYDGDVAKAVGAYNSGEGNADKGRIPEETRKYVPKVLELWAGAGAGTDDQLVNSVLNRRQAGGGGGEFSALLPNMLVTSRYGQRNTGIEGASRNHQGIDLRAAIGTPVSAPMSGVVETADYKGKNGNYVVIRHDDGRKTFYLHLSKFASGLKPGQRVEKGQLFGYTGNSGDFKKPLIPHLDFRLWENGRFIDPAPLFAGLKYKKGA